MDFQTVPPSSIGRLIGELIGDCRTLVQQHVQLLKNEIDMEISKAKRASLAVMLGGVLLALGGLLFVIMLVHLLQWSTAWPLWACYGLVGLLLVMGGAIAVRSGKQAGASVHIVPTKTLQSLKEDAQWLTQTIASKKM